MALEDQPWHINIPIDAKARILIFDKNPAIAKLMCLIDEYAINTFKSFCEIQITLIQAPPSKANLEINIFIKD